MSNEAGWWTEDHRMMSRLESLSLLTQRTDFIVTMLGLPLSETCKVKQKIRTLLEKNNMTYNPPRGKFVLLDSSRRLNGAQRYALLILLRMMKTHKHRSIRLEDLGRPEIVDLLIATFRRYLDLTRSSVADAPVSFILFVMTWRAEIEGKSTETVCDNCGSRYRNFSFSFSLRCPVCTNLELPNLPKNDEQLGKTLSNRLKTPFTFQ